MFHDYKFYPFDMLTKQLWPSSDRSAMRLMCPVVTKVFLSDSANIITVETWCKYTSLIRQHLLTLLPLMSWSVVFHTLKGPHRQKQHLNELKLFYYFISEFHKMFVLKFLTLLNDPKTQNLYNETSFCCGLQQMTHIHKHNKYLYRCTVHFVVYFSNTPTNAHI